MFRFCPSRARAKRCVFGATDHSLRFDFAVGYNRPMIKPKLAIFSVIGTSLYLGLAVFGAGGFAAFFSRPAFVALSIATFALVAVSLFTNASLSPGERTDRGN